MAKASGENHPHAPVFIIGLPRSGTSLLNTLINRHAKVALMREFNLFLFHPCAFLLQKKLSKTLQRLELFNSMVKFHAMDTVFEEEKAANRAEACAQVYNRYAAGNNAAIGGEKSPVYYTKIRQLAASYPHARFIYILRPIEEVANSFMGMMKKNHQFRRPGSLAQLLMGQEAIFRQLKDTLPRERVLVLSFKALISDTETAMKKVAAFLQIDFDPAMSSLPSQDAASTQPNKAFQSWGKIIPDQIKKTRYDRPLYPDDFGAKIECYKARWHALYTDSYNIVYSGAPEQSPLSSSARWRDAFAAAFNRYYAGLSFLFFSFCPLFLLRAYRSLRPLPSPNTPKKE